MMRAPGHRRRALLIVVALAIGAGPSCVDRVTGLGGSRSARLTVSMALPEETPEVWFPRGDTLGIAVRRAGWTAPIADTAVVIDAALQATLDVPLAQMVERFVVQAEVTIGELVYFLAFEALELRADADTIVVLTARYVGPAANAASLELLPADESLAPADSTRLTVVVRDADGNVISNPPVRFLSHRPALVSVRPDGVASAPEDAPADTARLAAWTPTGVSAATLLRVARGTPLPVDGTITFISERDGRRELYVARDDGTNAVRLTATAEDEWRPAWSPDGSRIVFERDLAAGTQLFIIGADGSGERQLTTEGKNHGARFSPDGSLIAFTSERSGRPEVWVINADGGGQRRLVDPQGRSDWFGDWSPDGARIAFLGDGGERGIYTATADGSAASLLVVPGSEEEGVSGVESVRWHPLGGRLGITTTSRGGSVIAAYDLDGSFQGVYTSIDLPIQDRYIGYGASLEEFVFERLEADGSRAIYRGEYGMAERLSPNGVTEREPDHLPPPEPIYVDRLEVLPAAAAITSDEQSQVFSVTAYDVRGQPLPVAIRWLQPTDRLTIDIDDVATLEKVAIAPGRTHAVASYAGWRTDSAVLDISTATGPTGARLVAAFSPDLGLQELFAVAGDGRDTTRLTVAGAENLEPAYSPDGRRIAWRSQRDGNADIHVMNADGSGVMRLTNEPEFDGYPSWSPDGRQIAFASERSPEGMRLWIMNADGSSPRQLTSDVRGEHVDPAWSPDGTQIVFTRYEAGISELYTVSPAGGALRLLDVGFGVARYPSWTPDGRAVLYSAWRDGTWRIARYDLATGTETVLTTGRSPRFPDASEGDHQPVMESGGLVAFWSVRYGGSQLFVMRADGTGLSGLLPAHSSHAAWRPSAPPRYVATVAIGGDVGSPLAAGETRQLTAAAADQFGASITPGAGFEWRSLDPGIATVDATGLVSGRAAGYARVVLDAGIAAPDTVTITIADGGGDGPFQLTGSMAVPRVDHAIALLPDGRVLVTGGRSTASGPALASAEIYDPASGTFTPTGSMTTARHGHTATALSDGRVLVIGGMNGAASLGTGELYDPASGTFSAITRTLYEARGGTHAATLMPDGSVLITGGNTGTSATASVELYRPATNDFYEDLGWMHAAREDHRAVLLGDGRVLVTGGHESTVDHASADLGRFDASRGTFTVTGAMSAARSEHTLTLLADGRVLVTGGYRHADGTTLQGAEIFDPVAGSFTTIASLAVPRRHHTATPLTDGRVLVAGRAGASVPAEIFDPAADTFAPTGALRMERWRHRAVRLATGQVLIVGGVNANGQVEASAELFTP